MGISPAKSHASNLASDYESEGCGFNSRRAHYKTTGQVGPTDTTIRWTVQADAPLMPRIDRNRNQSPELGRLKIVTDVSSQDWLLSLVAASDEPMCIEHPGTEDVPAL